MKYLLAAVLMAVWVTSGIVFAAWQKPQTNSLTRTANIDGQCMGESMKPVPCSATDPLDVPAIQETQKITRKADCNSCKFDANGYGSCTLMNCGTETVDEKFWTCADKSRILEHDENTPPKYWCRKSQP